MAKIKIKYNTKQYRMWYSGSILQQDYSEHPFNHGYILWNIESKEKFSTEFIKIPNPHISIPIILAKDENGKIVSDTHWTELMNAYIADLLYVDEELSKNCKIILKLKDEFSDEEINTFIRSFEFAGISASQFEVRKENQFEMLDSKIGVRINENYYDINIQEKTLKEYLKSKEIEDDVVENVIDLNREINNKVKIKEQVLRNQNVDIQSIEIENLFSYKEKQIIDVSNEHNIVIGINGKNASGKSSIPDILLWILYGKFNRSTTKSGILNNEATKRGIGTLYFKINDWEYRIVRTINAKKQGTTAFEVIRKDELNAPEWVTYFEVGDTKRDTDKLITKFFGTYDDLVFTNVASQDALASVIENKRLRKDVVNRFLGLDIFGECYAIANKEKNIVSNKFDELKSAKQKLNVDLMESQLAKAIKEKAEILENLDGTLAKENDQTVEVISLKSQIVETEYSDLTEEQLNKRIENATALILEYQKTIATAPVVKEMVQEQISTYGNQIDLEAKIDALELQIDELNNKKTNEFKNHSDKVKSLIVEKTKDLLSTKLALAKEVDSIFSFLTSQREEQKNYETFLILRKEDIDTAKHDAKLIDSVPCNGVEQYSQCKFLSKAIQSRDSIKQLEKDLDAKINSLATISNIVSEHETLLTDGKLNLIILNNQIQAIEDETRNEQEKLIEKIMGNFITSVDELYTRMKQFNLCIQEILKLTNKLNQADLILSQSQNKLMQEEKKMKDLGIALSQISLVKMLLDEKIKLEKIQNTIAEHREVLEIKVQEIGKYEGLIVSANELQRQIDTYSTMLKSYQIYLQAYDTDGIPHNLVETVIAYLQNKVNSILQMNNVDFKVTIEVDEDKDLYLFKHANRYKIPIDFCSGMEKTIISIAFRVAYSEINSLCKLNLFIIDEAFTTFDSDNIQNIGSIFKYLSKQFDKLVIISHLDSIKEYYGVTFQVEKTDSGSKIERV